LPFLLPEILMEARGEGARLLMLSPAPGGLDAFRGLWPACFLGQQPTGQVWR
jgi:hypothetical protein